MGNFRNVGDFKFEPFIFRRAKIQINNLFKFYPESPIANLAIGSYYSYLSKSPLPFLTDVTQLAFEYNKRALDFSNKILRTTPNDPIAIYAMRTSYQVLIGICYNQRKFREALYYSKEWNKFNILSLNKRDEYNSTFQVAQIYGIIKNYDKSLFYFKRFFDLGDQLELTDNSHMGFYWVGRILLSMGRYDKASKMLNNAIENNPNDEYSYNLIGDAYLYQAMFQLAEKAFLKRIALEKNHYWSYRSLAISYQKMGLYEKALSYFSKAIDLSDDADKYTHIFHFLCFQEAGQTSKARNYIVETSEKYLEMDWIKEILNFYSGESTEESFFSAAKNVDPNTEKGQKCEAFYYIGMAHLLKINYTLADTLAAINSFNKCLETKVTDYVEYGLAGLELRRLGKFKFSEDFGQK